MRIFPPVSTCVPMTVTAKNTCLSESTRASNPGRQTPVKPRSGTPMSESSGFTPGVHGIARALSADDECSGVAAHDLKTPLSHSERLCGVAANEKLGPLSDRQRDVLLTCRPAHTFATVIQDFLTYSVLETGGLKSNLCGDVNHVPVRGCVYGRIAFNKDIVSLFCK